MRPVVRRGAYGLRVPDVADAAKRVFVGRALSSEKLGDTLLPKRIALPVFASDALSSNAYATQEILLTLGLGGFALYAYGPWVAAAVVIVFFTVVASYRQNVHAYPSGGGDYEVVTENLGPRWGVFVASALLIDYVLTVAVSISSAVAQMISTFPALAGHRAPIAVGIILLITFLNLRGVRESGTLFAIPTYGFMIAIFAMVGFAILRLINGDTIQAESANWTIAPEGAFAGGALLFLIARAFTSGTTALTGIEALSNGVPAFQKPKSKNAATTLLLLGLISMSMFAAITWLAIHTGVKVTEYDKDLIGLPEGQPQKTVIVQIADAVFSGNAVAVVIIALATALILALAANTAFNGFPVLGSILARDGFMPRQLHTRGDRLAFSNGILVLSGLAILLVVIYDAQVTALIQLYILGVFVSFTLSQAGMVRHWTRLLADPLTPASERGRMIRSRLINTAGLLMTGSVLVIVLATKFTRGAWIVCIAMPLIWLIMQGINRHYAAVKKELEPETDETVMLPSRVHAIVLVSKIHRPTLRALAYARATRPSTLTAVTVDVDANATEEFVREWEEREIPVRLLTLASPYREITRPIIEHVKGIHLESPRDLVTVYVPEYVVGHWWEQLLHNQSALRLKTRLLFTPGVMVVSVPWQLQSSERKRDEPEVVSRPGDVRRGEPDPRAEIPS